MILAELVSRVKYYMDLDVVMHLAQKVQSSQLRKSLNLSERSYTMNMPYFMHTFLELKNMVMKLPTYKSFLPCCCKWTRSNKIIISHLYKTKQKFSKAKSAAQKKKMEAWKHWLLKIQTTSE